MAAFDRVLWIALGALIAALAGYLTAYFKEQGKNDAIRDGLDNILLQLRATTQATKEIEAKIDNQMWNRQRQWEMRRDVLFEAARRLAQVDEALLSLHAVIGAMPKEDDPGWLEAKIERQNNWRTAAAAFDE